nr:hypothetical protein [Tanacetum cinerariifolium]
MIPEPCDLNREVPVNETFHVQTDDELTEKELKQIEADDQAIQTILLGLPEDIYPAIDSCETAQKIWLRVQQMMKGSDIGIQEKKANKINTFQKRLPVISMPHQDQPSFNQNYMQQPMPNPEDITDPTTAMNMALALIAKAFKLNYSTPNNNNQRISSNLRNRQIAQPGNANQNTNGNGNLVATHAEGNATGHNGIQLQAKEFDLMAAAADLDEIKEVNANCILMANLQQASTSGTQTDKAPVYDSDGSAEIHNYENCYNNEIFNIFTQEEQYTELLEPIPEPHQLPQNDNNVISEVTSVEQSGETVEQHYANVEEIRVLYDSLYHNLAIEVEKVNTVNHKLKETNAELITELARYKNPEKCFEISQEKYDKLERCYQKSVYQEQCLSKKDKCSSLKFCQDIMSIVQNNSVGETSNLQTKLKECKFDKISYDKAYNGMQHKIKQLQAQLGDLKGKSKDTSCVSDTLNPLCQKLKNKNMELEFQVLNYAKENAHLKNTYKNLFDSISVIRPQTKTIIASLQNKLHDMIYENAKLRAQLFDTVSNQKDTTRGTSANTKFAKQSILGNLPKVGMFRINHFKPSREEKYVPNKVRASVRTNLITVSQPPVITKKVVNSDSNGLSSIGVDITAKTKRP